MALVPQKQSSSGVTVYKSREETVNVLFDPATFETREPNSFADFGAEQTLVARSPFTVNRQRQKGSSVDRDVTLGWNEDFTANNSIGMFEEFCFAERHAKPKTTATAAVAATDKYTVASEAGFVANSIVLAKGFANPANNGLHVVTAAAAGEVTVGNGLVDEAGATGTLEVVGYQFPAADLVMSAPAGACVITSAAMDMATFGLLEGEWVVIGDDDVNNNFGNALRGYARIGVGGIDEDGEFLRFDKTTFVAGAQNGVGKTIRIFFGTVVRNEPDPDDIVKLTSTVERPLGKDADGRQSEVLTGATPNELTWNSPLAALVNYDVTYVGMQKYNRKGVDGLLVSEVGTVVTKNLGEKGWNTSRNLFRARMAVIDPVTLNPSPIFAKVTEWTQTINNNITPDKAQGIYGAFDTTEGDFEVDGEFTCYFKDTIASDAIDEDADVTFDAIYSKDNAAFIMDLPLLGLGGGMPEIEKNTAIMLPITTAAAESPFGYTLLLNFFSYVPNFANATGAV